MKAIIHIGSQKTGTKTIQLFLDNNHEELKERGVFPARGPASDCHVNLKRAVLTQDDYESFPFFPLMQLFFDKKKAATLNQNELWEKCRHSIVANCSHEHIVIFSNEGFSIFSEKEVKRVKELLHSLFDDVTVILYLRRQPEFHISLYSTMVQLGLGWSFFDYINDSGVRVFSDYRKLVERWSVFGKDKIRIRIFDKQEFHEHDLLSDFANTAGFDIAGLQRVEYQNISMNSAETECLRLLNTQMLEPMTRNPNRSIIYRVFSQERKGRKNDNKPYYLNRSEAQQILERYRDGNDWIAREYLDRDKLFNDDVSMYPTEVTLSHHLTLDRSIDISARLLKSYSEDILYHQSVIQKRNETIQQLMEKVKHHEMDAQQLRAKILQQEIDLQHSHDYLALLQQKHSICWHYYRCKVLAKITFGKMREYYKVKCNTLHEKVRKIRNQNKGK